MLFPPSRKCKTFCSSLSCLIQLCSPSTDAKMPTTEWSGPYLHLCTTSLQRKGATLNLAPSPPCHYVWCQKLKPKNRECLPLLSWIMIETSQNSVSCPFLLRPLMGKSNCLQKSQHVVKQAEVASDMRYFHLFLKWIQALSALFWFTHTPPSEFALQGKKKKVLQ